MSLEFKKYQMAFQNIYVAATSQHVGKTTSTLGLIAAYHKEGVNVGYCKPVGQQHIAINDMKVDKDTVLFADLLHFDIEPAIHSPIILPRGATEMFLDHPEKYDVASMILHSKNKLEQKHDLVIYEGTGHPGVGSVAELSNAQVAKMLDAKVIMVVEGGIGSTIDKLNMCSALFREEGVEVLGVIINKVFPDKIEKITNYVGKWLDKKNIALLGVVPYDRTLAYPLVWTINKAIGGNIEMFSERGHNRVADILGGSFFNIDDLVDKKDLLLVVSSRGLREAIKKVIKFGKEFKSEDSPLSGIVVTGEYSIPRLAREYVKKYKIPIIRTDLDTYGAVISISKIEVKINRKTPWKIAKAIELIRENVNTDLVTKVFNLNV